MTEPALPLMDAGSVCESGVPDTDFVMNRVTGTPHLSKKAVKSDQHSGL